MNIGHCLPGFNISVFNLCDLQISPANPQPCFPSSATAALQTMSDREFYFHEVSWDCNITGAIELPELLTQLSKQRRDFPSGDTLRKSPTFGREKPMWAELIMQNR